MQYTAPPSWIGILGLTLGLAIAGQAIVGFDAEDVAHQPVTVTVVGTPDDMADLAWAHQRFAAAGLKPPEIDIAFHDDAEACEGNMGTVRISEDGDPILRVCADHDKPQVRRSWRRRTLIHELAHLWEARTLDDEDRTALMELRGLTAWNDRSTPWADRATEHAAEIITWGIGDPAWRFDARPQSSCEEMAAGYELLTGTTAPRILQEGCAGLAVR